MVVLQSKSIEEIEEWLLDEVTVIGSISNSDARAMHRERFVKKVVAMIQQAREDDARRPLLMKLQEWYGKARREADEHEKRLDGIVDDARAWHEKREHIERCEGQASALRNVIELLGGEVRS